MKGAERAQAWLALYGVIWGFQLSWEWAGKGVPWELTFELGLEGSLEVGQAGTGREGVPGRGNSSCKGMEAHLKLRCLWNGEMLGGSGVEGFGGQGRR